MPALPVSRNPSLRGAAWKPAAARPGTSAGPAPPHEGRVRQRSEVTFMRRTFVVAAIPIACVAVAILPLTCAVATGKTPSKSEADSLARSYESALLDTLADTERAFSALSVEKGMKEAFLHYLAADGLVFRPGPVNGRKVWEARTNPRGTLIWEPTFAEVAGNGDLGFTSGPWEYRPPEGGDVSYGHFVTVWARPIEWVPDEEMVWRVAAELGISHPKPERGLGAVPLER